MLIEHIQCPPIPRFIIYVLLIFRAAKTLSLADLDRARGFPFLKNAQERLLRRLVSKQPCAKLNFRSKYIRTAAKKNLLTDYKIAKINHYIFGILPPGVQPAKQTTILLMLTMTDDHLAESGRWNLDCHSAELTQAWERLDGRVLNQSEEKETGFWENHYSA